MQFLDEIDYTQPDFADFYDELPLWSAPFGLLLLDRIPLQVGITVLDVGAGTGFITLELAQRCGPTATIIAVDPWVAAMSRLRRKVARLGVTNVQLLEHDAAQLQLADASVDLVVSNLGINNFKDAEAVLRTCCRVMKPNATLVLTTNLVGHMQEFYAIYRRTLVQLGRDDRLAALEAHEQHRGSVESTSRMLERAGLAVTATTTGTFRMRFADGSSFLRHHGIRLGFLPGWKSVVDSGCVEETFVELERQLNAAAAQAGELSLTIPMVCIEARKA